MKIYYIIVFSLFCFSVISFCIYKMYGEYQEDNNKLPTYRIVERKLLNENTVYQVQYRVFLEWKKLYSYEFDTLEIAKKFVEQRIKQELEDYSKKTSIKETIVLQSKKIRIK